MSKKINLESDSKYRSYSVAIDKCLKSFESSNEWADLISSLVRLMKLIQQYERYDVIPKKRLLGKRLAQCLHPALPPGVHVKTLECFDLIFRVMGPVNLAADIGIYGPCLFGLLGPSAMTVKPILFNIFETYFLPLGDKLRTSFVGLLQGLLPGLEEGSEFFERGNSIIEQFCKVVGSGFFYTCLWQVLIKAPSVRHFGTAYILNHFNKRRALSTQADFFGTSTPVLLESIRCLLGDTVVLVQRDTLDFVILTLPVHLASGTATTTTASSKTRKTPPLSGSYHPLEGCISTAEMRDLVTAALAVLMRKDASLNRRLFIWLLGSQPVEYPDAAQQATTTARLALLQTNSLNNNDSDTAIQLQYFKTFGLQVLKEALQGILKSTLVSQIGADGQSGNRSSCFRPFRLMSGLLNRPEIGVLLVEQVLVDFIFFTLRMYHRLQRISGGGGVDEKPSPPNSATSSPGELRNRHSAIPQQTLEMLTQFESYASAGGVLSRRSNGSINSRGNDSYRSGRYRTPSDLFYDASANATVGPGGVTKVSGGRRGSTGLLNAPTEAEFMREAELFFSNLESHFLWPFLQARFFVTEGWVRAVRFLVEHLPIDTYPEVRGCHLPKMVSGLCAEMGKRMDTLSLAEIGELVELIELLIGQIQEHMATMLDQSMIETPRAVTAGHTATSSSSDAVIMQRNKETTLIAAVVGDIRGLLAAFFKRFLSNPTIAPTGTSDPIDSCLETLRRRHQDGIPLDDLEEDFHDFLPSTESENERAAVVDLLGQLCRLVVEMCNVPLIPSTNPTEVDFNQLFCSDGTQQSPLPEWLACLLAAAALSADFDIKSICLHTVLDLVEASTSIHGWSSTDDKHSRPSSRLLLPVLTPDALWHIASTLEFFPVSGISLWFFLDNASVAEDVASLLIRLLLLASNRTSTEALVEEFFLTQMLSSDAKLRLTAHLRFSLLWKLLHRVSSSVSRGDEELQTSTRTGSSTSNGLDASGLAGWRRAAMRLPPVSNDGASNSAAFNRCLLLLLDNLDETESISPGQSASLLYRDALNLPESSSTTMTTSSDATPPKSAKRRSLELASPSKRRVSPDKEKASIKVTSNASGGDRSCQEAIRRSTRVWLATVLTEGQVGRVVAPIFATLLHPTTARTSLVSIRRRRRHIQRALRRRMRREKRLRAGHIAPPTADGNPDGSDVDALDSAASKKDSELDEGYDDSESDFWDLDSDAETGDFNDGDDNFYDADEGDAEDEEYDRNICALSGGSPSGELHFYTASASNSQTAESKQTGSATPRTRRRLAQLMLRRRRRDKKREAAATEGDVFDETYRPVDVMTRLQSSTNRKAGNANGNTNTEAEQISLNRARRDVIQALLSQMLGSNGDSTKAELNLSTFDQLLSSPVRLLPVHEHLLVYLHQYDFNQVMYAFSRLRSILRHDSEVGVMFVLALAATPTASGPSTLKERMPFGSACEFPQIFGTSLPDLLARHCRCLMSGGTDDFARDATMEEINAVLTLRTPSLLDVLVFVCLIFLTSIMPPCGTSSSAAAAANASVRLIASEVLQLITERLLQLTKVLSPTSEARKGSLEVFKEDSGMSALVGVLEESGTAWIGALIQRSGLSQAVLHCLATTTEMAHLRESLRTADDSSSLPLCLRLLKSNSSATDNTSTELGCLLRLTENLLQLTSPFNSSSIHSTTLASSSNTATPTSTRAGAKVPSPNPPKKTPPSDTASTPKSSPASSPPSGALPWCPSSVSHSPSVVLNSLEALNPPLCVQALQISRFIGSRHGLRHVATQTLLLNTLRVGVMPGGRLDLQPTWFGFLRGSLVHWGTATPMLINLAVTQLSAGLQMLSEAPSGLRGYPPDYTIQLLACLQGIIHTFVLPFGQSKSSLWHGMTFGATAFARDWSPSDTRLSPQHKDKSHSNTPISKSGTPSQLISSTTAWSSPEAFRDALLVADALRDFYAQYQAQCLDILPVSTVLQRIQQGLIDAGHSEGRGGRSGLPPALLIAAKDLLGSEVMPISSTRAVDWARGRAETCHVLPIVVSSLASVWLALNKLCDGPPADSVDLEASTVASTDVLSVCTAGPRPVMRHRCHFELLSSLTLLGHPEVIRCAIVGLLEPIAHSHPSLLLSGFSFVWPPLGAPTSVSDLLWLLSSSPKGGLPLTPRQCALVSLLSGIRWSYRRCGDKISRFVTLASPRRENERPVGLMKPSQAVKTLKGLLRSPPVSMAVALSMDLPASENGNIPNGIEMMTQAPQLTQSCLLHLFYAWMVSTAEGDASTGSFNSSSLQSFLRDVVPLTSISAAVVATSGGSNSSTTAITAPLAVFLLVKIFNELIVALSNKEEKREQKDLQDICQRLMESTASIAGTALEQANWFRKGLQVRAMGTTASIISGGSSAEISGTLRPSSTLLHTVASESALGETGGRLSGSLTSNIEPYDLSVFEYREAATLRDVDLSVLALKILAEHMAVFFDVVYKSEEKERVPSALNNGILTNILPFLKSHNAANSAHYTAASQVLASLSSYQFTRRAWRRDVFELVVDAAFFQAPSPALVAWIALVDNLMTQEKNTFKEALTRLTVSQGSGLNIFSSKEAECEQRAAHLKKINFIVFASEREQYARSVSDILERLTDNLRAMTDVNVPILTQLFLCTRVLIARISAESLASLWFIVIPELLNVFRIFAERCNGRSKKHPALNYEGLQNLPPAQLTLLLAASKLLATILLLPETIVPQLLFYRWVFVNRQTGDKAVTTVADSDTNETQDGSFQPLMTQISSGLTSIYQRAKQIYTTQLLPVPSACLLILSTQNATSFDRLELFFRSLGERRAQTEASSRDPCVEAATMKQIIEVALFNEFAEPMLTPK